jgi:hypothetical protein
LKFGKSAIPLTTLQNLPLPIVSLTSISISPFLQIILVFPFSLLVKVTTYSVSQETLGGASSTFVSSFSSGSQESKEFSYASCLLGLKSISSDHSLEGSASDFFSIG